MDIDQIDRKVRELMEWKARVEPVLAGMMLDYDMMTPEERAAWKAQVDDKRAAYEANKAEVEAKAKAEPTDADYGPADGDEDEHTSSTKSKKRR